MKKLVLFVCLLVATVAAQAQFEKGKWIVNPSISGLGLSHNTDTDKTSFGIEAKGGAFLLDNVALLVHAGAAWNNGGSDTDVYTLGVGGRYYFSNIGIYLGADVNVDRWDWGTSDDTKFSFGAEAGYAFFLTRTVTLEPAVYWNVNSDRSVFGLKELTRIAFCTSRYFLRCTCRHQISTFITAFRSEVYHVVGTFDNIHVVFNDYNGVST